MNQRPDNHPEHYQPQQEFDKTYVEGAAGRFPGYSNLNPGTRINATSVPQVNPYTQTGGGYLAPADILPSGNDPVPLGSGTVVGLLGSGGMAKVYKIWNEKLEVFRAVKILLPTQQADLKSRFETEAKITAKLHHPNIVEIYGVGEWNGLPILEMEYIDGVSLEALIMANGKLPDVVCSAISILVASALQYAHCQEFLIYGKTYHGVIHRDLKPANIMIPSIGDVRLMDFGIARPTEASLHTVEGNIVGTMQYLSPEQLDGIDIDARSDIYSFGAILYEILTGTKTFPQDTITNLMKKKIMNEYRKISDFDFQISGNLAKIAQKCLQLNKTDRFPDASALLSDLESAHRSLTSESPAAILKQYMSDPESIKNARRSLRLPRISPKVVIPTLGVLGIGALVTVFILTGPDGTDSTGDGSTTTADTTSVHRQVTDVPQPPRSPDSSTITVADKKDTVPVPPKPYIPPSGKTGSGTIGKKPSEKHITVTQPTITPKPLPLPLPPPPQPDLSPIDELKQRYGTDDLITIGKSASKAKVYKDVLLAIQSVPAGQGDEAVKNLLLFDAYLQTGKIGDALLIANKENIIDAQFDYLCGRLYEQTNKNKKALEYYQSALTKPSVIRSRTEIRNDALFQTALLWTEQHRDNPTPDSRIQALNAWNTVKKTYMATPDNPRFKRANTELASIQ